MLFFRMKRTVLSVIKIRSEKLLDNLIRHKPFITNKIIEAEINGWKGRPRRTFVGQMMGMADYSRYSEIKKMTPKIDDWEINILTDKVEPEEGKRKELKESVDRCMNKLKY